MNSTMQDIYDKVSYGGFSVPFDLVPVHPMDEPTGMVFYFSTPIHGEKVTIEKRIVEEINKTNYENKKRQEL